MKRFLSLVMGLVFSIGTAMAAVNLNTATVEQLDAVKGIGPAKAKAIVDYRSKNGPFKTVGDLKNVKGFGEKSVAKLQGELSVSDVPAAAHATAAVSATPAAPAMPAKK